MLITPRAKQVVSRKPIQPDVTMEQAQAAANVKKRKVSAPDANVSSSFKVAALNLPPFLLDAPRLRACWIQDDASYTGSVAS